MGRYGRFNFDGYTPEYPNEEAMLADYLNDLRGVVPIGVYRDIFNSLLKNDKKALADILTKNCKDIKKLWAEAKRTKELEEERDQLRREIGELEQKLRDVYNSDAGLDLWIRDLYVEQKKSLRQIAEIVGKDKNTVKKHLVKMGVYKEKSEVKGDKEDIAKSLAQHLKFDEDTTNW